METEELKQFLVKAKKNTYASGDENQTKFSSGGTKEYIFKEGNFKYVDRYIGHEKFAGKEEVYKSNKLIWEMEYEGNVLLGKTSTNDVYYFLRKVLKQIPEDKPFRGPEELTDEKYRYTNEIEGDIEKFSGTEQIFYKK